MAKGATHAKSGLMVTEHGNTLRKWVVIYGCHARLAFSEQGCKANFRFVFISEYQPKVFQALNNRLAGFWLRN